MVSTLPLATRHSPLKNMRQVLFHDLGLIPYADAWALQTRLFQATIDRKLANRSLPENEQHPTEDHLLFCEHPHVFTLGKSGKQSHLLLNEEGLREKGVQFFPIAPENARHIPIIERVNKAPFRMAAARRAVNMHRYFLPNKGLGRWPSRLGHGWERPFICSNRRSSVGYPLAPPMADTISASICTTCGVVWVNCWIIA